MSVKDIIKKRRAYRSLDPVEITNKLIKDLAEMVKIAPSCMNNQPWRFIFVHDEGILKNLHATLSKGNKWVENASMMIAVYSKPDFDCQIKGRDYYLFDTGLATAFLVLRATELGLVAHPIAGFNEEEAKKALSIPNHMRLITFVNIGKHSKEINPDLSDNMKKGEKNRPPRKSLGEIVFINKFGNAFKPPSS